MLVLEEFRGREYSARELEAKQRYFVSSPPDTDSSADFSGSGFRVLGFDRTCYSFCSSYFLFFGCLPSATALCSYKFLQVVLVYFRVSGPPAVLLDSTGLNCRHSNFALLTGL